MTAAGYYNSGKRLEEGKEYLFRVFGRVTLQDGQEYFILEDPYKIRHLLPSWLYESYGIKTSQSIRCKVDKINCTGRVYLEPEHPYYVAGNTYDFTFHSIGMSTRSQKLFMIVTDMFNNEVSVDCPKDFNIENSVPETVSCKIIRIRKGKPVIVLSSQYKLKV
jgi:hypothetical protein